MGFDSVVHALGMMFQVFLLDLILSGDNAVMIALACRSLPQHQIRKVILIGTGAAIFLRVALTTVVTFLLSIPSLRLIGGLALIYIALKLMVEESDPSEHQTAGTDLHANGRTAAQNNMWPTIIAVVIADLVMSLDNVVALAAAVHGSIFFLILGLLLSVPLLMYGSLFVSKLLNRYPILVPTAGALLGWIAGDISVSDPLIADWVNTQSPALTIVMPLLCGVFVLLQSKILKETRHTRKAQVSNRPRKVPLPSLTLPMTQTSSGTEKANHAHSDGVHPSLQSTSEHRQSNDVALHTAQALVAENRPALAAQNRQTTNATTHKALQRPAHKQLPSPFRISRRNGLLAAAASLALIAVLVFSYFGQSFTAAPKQLLRYDCPGFNGTLSIYYKHGDEQVQMRSSRNVVDGNIHYGKIDWGNRNDASTVLGFVPPDEISSGDSTSIQISGGNFAQLICPRHALP